VKVACGGCVDEGFCQGRRSKEGSGEVGHFIAAVVVVTVALSTMRVSEKFKAQRHWPAARRGREKARGGVNR